MSYIFCHEGCFQPCLATTQPKVATVGLLCTQVEYSYLQWLRLALYSPRISLLFMIDSLKMKRSRWPGL